MNTNYKIIDNFLPEDQFKYLQNIVLSEKFPYYFIKSLNYNQKDVTEKSPFYFIHILYENYQIFSGNFNDFKPILNKLSTKALIRMKINLYPRTEKIVEHAFHSDQGFSHKGCILYFNTCDGYTLLEDGTKIDTIENRVLLFDSGRPHASTSCTDVKARVNVNINYL
jgi:hypothetical protein